MDTKRNDLIRDGITNGLTYAEIGATIGVSRQRVYQLIKQIDSTFGRPRLKAGGRPRHPIKVRWLNIRIYRVELEEEVGRRDTFDSLREKLPDLCPILGIPLAYTGCSETSAVLHFLDPTKGWELGNVVVISARAAELRGSSNWSAEEHIKMAEWLRSLERPQTPSESSHISLEEAGA